MKQSPIFIKHYDLMAWLIPQTIKFPKSQRGILAKQIQAQLFQIQESLVAASINPKQANHHLKEADQTIICLRTYLRLCRDLTLLTPNQFQHVSGLVAEVGRLLGGWQKTSQKKG